MSPPTRRKGTPPERPTPSPIDQHTATVEGRRWLAKHPGVQRANVLGCYVANLEAKLCRPDLPPSERAQIDRRVRAAWLVIQGSDPEQPIKERRRVLLHALTLVLRARTEWSDDLGARQEDFAVETMRALLEANLASSLDALSDKTIRDAVTAPATGKAKWKALNQLAKAIGCGAADDEAFRTQWSRLHL